MALGNLLDTAEGRAELRELISAVRQEDPDGEAAGFGFPGAGTAIAGSGGSGAPGGEAEPSGRCPGHLGAGESAGSHAGAGAPAR